VSLVRPQRGKIMYLVGLHGDIQLRQAGKLRFTV
jgi:hypothetical protein